MALHNLTPSASWDTPKSVSSGDKATAAQMDTCLQAAANRTHYLRTKHDAAPSCSDASAFGTVESVTDTGVWKDSTIITRTHSGAAGDIVNLLLTASCTPDTSAGIQVDFRIKVVDNGTMSYVAGATQRIHSTSAGTAYRVVLCGKHEMSSASAILTLQVKISDGSGSADLQAGWSIMTW